MTYNAMQPLLRQTPEINLLKALGWGEGRGRPEWINGAVPFASFTSSLFLILLEKRNFVVRSGKTFNSVLDILQYHLDKYLSNQAETIIQGSEKNC